MNSTATEWSELPDGTVKVGRRELLVLSASAVAALYLAGAEPFRQIIAPAQALSPAHLVRSFPKVNWDWTVELAVLHRIDTDRPAALALLRAALELDLDPSQNWRLKPALRLYDLFAAASDSARRAALSQLIRSQSRDPALLARATLWSDASRLPHPRLWRTVGPDRRPLGIYLAAA